MSPTRYQLLVLFQRIAGEKDPRKLAMLTKQLYALLRRLERENFDPTLAASERADFVYRRLW